MVVVVTLCQFQVVRIDPLRFLAECHKKATKPLSVVYLTMLYVVLLFIFYVLLVFVAMCSVF